MTAEQEAPAHEGVCVASTPDWEIWVNGDDVRLFAPMLQVTGPFDPDRHPGLMSDVLAALALGLAELEKRVKKEHRAAFIAAADRAHPDMNTVGQAIALLNVQRWMESAFQRAG